MNLSELKKGQKGIITRLNADYDLKRRLMTMGFMRGEEVVLDKIAPLGDPFDYVIKKCHVSLRRREAETIEIEIEPSKTLR